MVMFSNEKWYQTTQSQHFIKNKNICVKRELVRIIPQGWFIFASIKKGLIQVKNRITL